MAFKARKTKYINLIHLEYWYLIPQNLLHSKNQTIIINKLKELVVSKSISFLFIALGLFANTISAAPIGLAEYKRIYQNTALTGRCVVRPVPSTHCRETVEYAFSHGFIDRAAYDWGRNKTRAVIDVFSGNLVAVCPCSATPIILDNKLSVEE